jgi:membrane protein implicated in regulation of membrane protease activity
MNTDRMLAWVGLTIGILGLIPIFRDASLQLQIAYSVVLVLLVAFFVFVYRSGRGPSYETLLMKKVLTIEDKGGTLAGIKREQKIRARFGNLEGVWWRGNIADGTLSDFKVDGRDPDRTETVGGTLSLYKAFKRPLLRNEEKTILWSMKANGSFKNDSETFGHETVPKTKELVLEINFPTGRPCRNPIFYVQVAGNYVGPQDGLENNAYGQQLVATVHGPKQGHTYCVDWEW